MSLPKRPPRPRQPAPPSRPQPPRRRRDSPHRPDSPAAARIPPTAGITAAARIPAPCDYRPGRSGADTYAGTCDDTRPDPDAKPAVRLAGQPRWAPRLH